MADNQQSEDIGKFGGAGGYCLRVRLVTNLMTTGLDRLNFLSGSV
jgi:hypothetical protein